MLEIVPMKHPEKVAKKELVLEQYSANAVGRIADFEAAWDSLLLRIRLGRDAYIKEAEVACNAKRTGLNPGGSTIGPLRPANNSNSNR